MPTRDEIVEQSGEEALLFAEGLDDALIGFAQRCGNTVALYDAEKCIEVMITQEGMTEEEAREHFDYNVLGAWVGDYTPMYAYLSNSQGESR